jgi:hypothetical protein
VIADYNETQVEKSMYEIWSPRAKESLVKWVSSGSRLDEIDGLVPEATTQAFLKAWSQNNYGKMGSLTLYYTDLSPGKRAGQIREFKKGIRLLEARITSIEDILAIETTVTCELKLTVMDNEINDTFVFRIPIWMLKIYQ